MKNIDIVHSGKTLIAQDLRDRMDLSDDEIKLILGYVEGHGYKL